MDAETKFKLSNKEIMMNKQEKQEMINELYDAQEKLFEVIETLDNYVLETGDQNAKAYLVDHLKIMASGDHCFLSRDLNIDDLIERVHWQF
jgi:3'-phosphoadenosine 5'-phosphosulfate (PAPS) 3'-phosphatase